MEAQQCASIQMLNLKHHNLRKKMSNEINRLNHHLDLSDDERHAINKAALAVELGIINANRPKPMGCFRGMFWGLVWSLGIGYILIHLL
jgi:hypothetical protein